MLESERRWLTLKGWAVLYFALLSVPAAVAAYYLMFSRPVNFNDDEGTMMMTVKQYLSGVTLYDRIVSGYGPVYYFFNWIIRLGSASAVTHDVTRATTAAMWVVCALAFALIVFQFTKSFPLAVAAHFLAFINLPFLGNEPGHPQELSMLLLLGLVAAGLIVETPGRRWLGMALLGTFTAGLLLIKVNLGVFAMVAVAMAILFQLPNTVLVRTGRIAVSAAALALPLVLMKVHLDDLNTLVFILIVAASTAALLPGLVRATRGQSLDFRDLWITIAAFAVAIAAAYLLLIAQGVSFYGVINSLVLINLKENVAARLWYFPLRLNPVWIVLAMEGFISALVIGRKIAADERGAYQQLTRLKLLFGIGVIFLALFRPPMPGYSPGRLALMPGFVTPFCWMVLYPPSKDAGRSQSFARLLLAGTAVLQTLNAYPFAGTQACFIRILLLMIGMVAIGDSMTAAVVLYRAASETLQWLTRATAIAIPIGVPLLYSALAYQSYRAYRSLPSLALPGAERIHLPEAQARAFQWLAQNVRAHCDTFIGMPGFLSLYFWTAAEPPTSINNGDWMNGFDNAQQSEVIAGLSMHPNACVVYNPYLVVLWNAGHLDMKSLPLTRYIFDNFKVAGETDSPDSKYYLMVRKERNVNIASASAARAVH